MFGDPSTLVYLTHAHVRSCTLRRPQRKEIIPLYVNHSPRDNRVSTTHEKNMTRGRGLTFSIGGPLTRAPRAIAHQNRHVVESVPVLTPSVALLSVGFHPPAPPLPLRCPASPRSPPPARGHNNLCGPSRQSACLLLSAIMPVIACRTSLYGGGAGGICRFVHEARRRSNVKSVLNLAIQHRDIPSVVRRKK